MQNDDYDFYNTYRYYKRSSLDPLPSTALSTIFDLTGFDSLDGLHKAQNRRPLENLSDDVQEALANLYEVRIDPEYWNDYTFHCRLQDEVLKLPFPYKACDDPEWGNEPEWTLSIYGVWVEEDTKNDTITIHQKVQIDTYESAEPRRKEDEALCKTFATSYLIDPDNETTTVIYDWLQANGIPASTAQRAVADEGFREDMCHSLQCGVANWTEVWGSPKLGNDLHVNSHDSDEDIYPG